jgi:hypothetical protein
MFIERKKELELDDGEGYIKISNEIFDKFLGR